MLTVEDIVENENHENSDDDNSDDDNGDDDNKNGENIDNGHEFHLPQSCPQMSQ